MNVEHWLYVIAGGIAAVGIACLFAGLYTEARDAMKRNKWRFFYRR